MNIKIYYPHKFEGFRVTEEMKARNVILQILERLEIPLIYYRCFGIFRRKEGKMELISYRFRVGEWYDLDARYELLIATLPFNIRVDDLDVNFQEYAYAQINSFIISEQWPISADLQDLTMNLAAYSCAIDFGQFDETKFRPGFLKNTINSLLPPSILKKYSFSAAESRIFANWNVQTEKSLNYERSLCILNYLGACEEFLPQFGCFITNALYNDVVPVRFGVRQNGLYVCRPDGFQVFEGRFNQLTIETPEGSKDALTITSRGLTHRFRFTSFIDVLKLIIFIERCVYPQEGYYDKDVEARQKVINDKKLQLEADNTKSDKPQLQRNAALKGYNEEHDSDFGAVQTQLTQFKSNETTEPAPTEGHETPSNAPKIDLIAHTEQTPLEHQEVDRDFMDAVAKINADNTDQ